MLDATMNDEIYKSLFEIVSFFNRPKQDKLLLQKSGVSLDTALFPLISRIAFFGSLGIVDLAEQVDRDHSTVSRQVDKLIGLGLVAPIAKVSDKTCAGSEPYQSRQGHREENCYESPNDDACSAAGVE
ncbi:MAG: hypothetical protein WDO06_02885 [Actinomycetota bacterium]